MPMHLLSDRLMPGVVPAMPATMKILVQGDRPNASGCPVTFPEQPILITKPLGVQVAVWPFKDHLQPQPMAGQRLIIPAVPGETHSAGKYRCGALLAFAVPTDNTHAKAQTAETASLRKLTNIP